MRICPICSKEYNEPPAISRRGKDIEICPLCGLMEAVNDFNEFILKNEVYTVYSDEADITFIMEDKNKTTAVVGFYYGEPDSVATHQFYGKLIAEYDE